MRYLQIGVLKIYVKIHILKQFRYARVDKLWTTAITIAISEIVLYLSFILIFNVKFVD